MSKKKKDEVCEIYIGNVPTDFAKEDLVKLFKNYNIKTCTICRSGKKTFSFMKLASHSDVASAISEMDSKMIQGRRLVVREFEEKGSKGRTSKHDQTLNKDSDSYNSLLGSEDFIPPLETPLWSQNTIFDDSSISQKPETCDKFRACQHGHLKLPTSGSGLTSEKSFSKVAVNTYNSSYAVEDSWDHTSQAQSSYCSSSSFPQLKGSRQVQQMEENGFHKLPKHRSTCLKHNYEGKNATKQSNKNPYLSASHNYSSNKSSEKLDYVHCTRKVISYNPRDLQNNEIYEPSSSEAVNVQVVNFPFGTSKKELLELFEDFSPLSVYISNNERGGDYTQAIVMLPSLDAAEAAIMELDNTIYKRRTLLVTIADDELDDFACNYDEEQYGDGDDSYYYGTDGEHSEQGYHCRSDRDHFSDGQLSRRLHDLHLS